jgi:hypothetical protein
MKSRFLWIFVVPTAIVTASIFVSWHLDVVDKVVDQPLFWLIGFFTGYVACVVQAISARSLP